MILLLPFLYSPFILALVILPLVPYIPDRFFPKFPLEPAKVPLIDPDLTLAKYQFNQVSNENLNYLFKDEILAPKSFVGKGNYIYSTLGDGRVVELNKKTQKISTIVRFNRPNVTSCVDNAANITYCGRPLGLVLGKDNHLYALEPAQGLFKINVVNKTKSLVALGPERPADLQGILNNLAFDPVLNDTVYVVVSCKRWPLDKIFWSGYEANNTGFILSVNLTSGTSVKILDKLGFPSDILVSRDKKNLLISERIERRIIKVPLTQVRETVKKKSLIKQPSVLSDDLPGSASTMRLVGNNLAVSIGIPYPSFTIWDNIAHSPGSRKFFGRTFILISKLINYVVCNFIAPRFLTKIEKDIISGEVLLYFLPKTSKLILLDSQTGEVKKSYSFSTPAFTDAYIDPDSGDLYLGSYKNNYIGHFKAKHWK